jgi:hypothetical protein
MVLPAGARECVCLTVLLIKRRNDDFQAERGFRHYEQLIKRFIALPKYTPATHNRRLIIKPSPLISQVEAQQQGLIASHPSVRCSAAEDVSKINHNIPSKTCSNSEG